MEWFGCRDFSEFNELRIRFLNWVNMGHCLCIPPLPYTWRSSATMSLFSNHNQVTWKVPKFFCVVYSVDAHLCFRYLPPCMVLLSYWSIVSRGSSIMVFSSFFPFMILARCARFSFTWPLYVRAFSFENQVEPWIAQASFVSGLLPLKLNPVFQVMLIVNKVGMSFHFHFSHPWGQAISHLCIGFLYN